MTLDSPITAVKGIGEELAKRFSILGVKTVGDLIENVPRRYEDYSHVSNLGDLHPGPVTIQAVITEVKGRYVRRGMHITEAIARDDSGSVRLVWFNQPYREGAVKIGQQYFISGQYELSNRRFAIMNPGIELVSDFPINTARIVPVYRETKGINSLRIRKALREVMPHIRSLPETLPSWLISQEGLIGRAQAIEHLHFPADNTVLAAARKRIGFEEVFTLSLAALLNKYELLKDTSLSIPFNKQLAQRFVKLTRSAGLSGRCIRTLKRHSP